ncbi:MAG TPA: hypothetical protein EYH40_03355 [Desulfurococcales archaeon]|nr:hypothetical protein [Desulfurococcales archaeon]
MTYIDDYREVIAEVHGRLLISCRLAYKCRGLCPIVKRFLRRKSVTEVTCVHPNRLYTALSEWIDRLNTSDIEEFPYTLPVVEGEGATA